MFLFCDWLLILSSRQENILSEGFFFEIGSSSRIRALDDRDSEGKCRNESLEYLFEYRVGKFHYFSLLGLCLLDFSLLWPFFVLLFIVCPCEFFFLARFLWGFLVSMFFFWSSASDFWLASFISSWEFPNLIEL